MGLSGVKELEKVYNKVIQNNYLLIVVLISIITNPTSCPNK